MIAQRPSRARRARPSGQRSKAEKSSAAGDARRCPRLAISSSTGKGRLRFNCPLGADVVREQRRRDRLRVAGDVFAEAAVQAEAEGQVVVAGVSGRQPVITTRSVRAGE